MNSHNVFTGTLGSLTANGLLTCNDWTTASNTAWSQSGGATYTDVTVYGSTAIPCTTLGSVYCLED